MSNRRPIPSLRRERDCCWNVTRANGLRNSLGRIHGGLSDPLGKLFERLHSAAKLFALRHAQQSAEESQECRMKLRVHFKLDLGAAGDGLEAIVHEHGLHPGLHADGQMLRRIEGGCLAERLLNLPPLPEMDDELSSNSAVVVATFGVGDLHKGRVVLLLQFRIRHAGKHRLDGSLNELRQLLRHERDPCLAGRHVLGRESRRRHLAGNRPVLDIEEPFETLFDEQSLVGFV